MLEKKLQELTEATNRLAAAQEAANAIATGPPEPATPPKKTRKKAPPKEEPEDEEDEEQEEEEETPKPPKKTAKKAAKKTAKKAAKKAPPEEEEEEESEEEDEFEDEDEVVVYKTVADHIRKTREALLKANGTKGPIPHKKLTKKLLEEWGIEKVSEVGDDQMGVFFEELKGAEDEAGLS